VTPAADTSAAAPVRESGAASPGAAFAKAAARLRSALARSELWPGMASSRATLEAGIEGMDRAREGLSGSLWILLLGGTGVGKSTLLDALAGKDIAPASVLRPTTVHTTFYAHREADLAPLGGVPPGAGELAAHSVEALRDKVVIDPPDFDSAVDANRRRLMPLLDAADLVIVVADGQKYRDEALYDLLARYRGEKAFLFVMNKRDLGAPREVRDDFRAALEGVGFESPRMLGVSARVAFEARGGGREPGETAGDFAELERIIADELDRARIREIKEANLSGIAAHVVAAFDRAVGADAREELDGWRAGCREITSSVSGELTSRFSRAVLGTRGKPHADELRKYLHGLQLFSFGGVFGVYLALSEKLRSLLGRAWSRPVDRIEARALAEARIRSVDLAGVGQDISGAAAEVTAGAAAAGLSAESARSRLDPAKTGLAAPGAAREAAAGAGAALEDLTAVGLAASRFNLRNLIYNLIPTLLLLAIPAYAGYSMMTHEAPFGRPADAALLALALIVAVSYLQAGLVRRAFARGSARALLDIEGRMAARLGAYVERGLLAPCDSLADDARAALDDLDAARAQIEVADTRAPAAEHVRP
jgi:hypothetical protein